MDYIIAKYCVNKDKPQLQCNGKCHLAKQLQVVTQDASDKDGSAQLVVFEAFLPVFFKNQEDLDLTFAVSSTTDAPNFFYQANYRSLKFSGVFKPPIFHV